MADLSLESVSVSAGPATILEDIGFAVPSGASMAVVGASGAGKTSLALTIMGLWRGTVRGRVLFGDRVLTSLPEKKFRELRGRRLVFLPQDPMRALNPAMSAGAQLREILKARRGLSRVAARIEALEWFERAGLIPADKVARLYPHELSGGMAQRVLIVMALACGPELLIADEPFSSLDPDNQAGHVEMLRALRSELGFSLLLITHDLELARGLTSTCAVLNGGRIVESGGTESVFEHPSHAYTRELVEAFQALSGVPEKGR